MKKKHLKIATRKSPMAIWQANLIKNKLLSVYPDLKIELIGLSTQGDENQQTSLIEQGGKSLFVKELQRALLNHEADIAVHCIKDMSVHDYPGLTLAAIYEREDARDAFISNQYDSIDKLPKDFIMGTASPRRESLIKSMHPSIKAKLIRGNVNTRLKKLDAGEYDGIILAVAGLKRLGLTHRIKQYLDPEIFIPAIGQGALGIECRSEDKALQSLLKILHHEPTAICVEAERFVNRRLNGDCYTPIGVHAVIHKEKLMIHAVVGNIDGKGEVKSQIVGVPKNANNLAENLANDLLQKGAKYFINYNK